MLFLYHNSFRLLFIRTTSVYWPITLTGPSGKSSTQEGMKPWCPLFVSLCLHPTKRLLIWQQGETLDTSFLSFLHCTYTRNKVNTWLQMPMNACYGVQTLLGYNIKAFCFSSRTEQLYQNVLALWHHSHINMKSVVSWHYLMADIRAIRNWNVASVCLTFFGFF